MFHHISSDVMLMHFFHKQALHQGQILIMGIYNGFPRKQVKRPRIYHFQFIPSDVFSIYMILLWMKKSINVIQVFVILIAKLWYGCFAW